MFHILDQIVHSHYLYGARIFPSNTQANCNFGTLSPRLALTVSRYTSRYYAAAAANPFTAAAAVRLAAASPPMKRARVMVPPQAAPIAAQRTVIAKSPSTPPARKPQGNVCLDELKTYCECCRLCYTTQTAIASVRLITDSMLMAHMCFR